MRKSVYKALANGCLALQFPEMSARERTALIDRSSVTEMEHLIGVKDYLAAAITALREGLREVNFSLNEDLLSKIMYSNPSSFTKLQNEISNRHFSQQEKSEAAYLMMEGIHNQWVSSNIRKFFELDKQDSQFLFMPIELIGFQKAMHHYVYVRDVLVTINLEPDRQDIKHLYKELQTIWQDSEGVHNPDALKRWLTSASYAPITPQITNFLRQDKAAVDRICDQILKHNPNFFTKD